ncbi:MAG TPA: tRNA dihydrouridine synthase DusB [Candidatus Kapabacteria bacterium]|jgi:tRNA-dihydrouridine synthase B|nr:tRNA dihydrouridine synthase DusB [Candidatus Kapabacteria bacterium]HPP39609.1 tRNA dihydrouridine synthase DusB [Candidatus Kapabacteria bacterium]
MKLNKIFRINNLEIKNGIFLAPMEGITDLPFRIICRRFGADIVYTEFVASEALIRDVEKSKIKIRVVDEERPVAVQIFGSDPFAMSEAAKIVEQAGADIIDINYGCWVKKVVSHNAGAALLKNIPLMNAITESVVKAVKIPVTVKTRLGWDKNSIIINEVAKMQEECGAKAIAVHCRTREMGMGGKADWSFIPEIKKNISIPLILNGDITSPETARLALEVDGADAIMIGRAVLGNPFIFRDAKKYIETGQLPDKPNINERFDVLLEHLKLNVEDKGLPRGLVEFRKHFSGYLKGLHNASHYRQKLVQMTNLNEVIELLEQYRNYLNNYYNEEH